MTSPQGWNVSREEVQRTLGVLRTLEAEAAKRYAQALAQRPPDPATIVRAHDALQEARASREEVETRSQQYTPEDLAQARAAVETATEALGTYAKNYQILSLAKKD